MGKSVYGEILEMIIGEALKNLTKTKTFTAVIIFQLILTSVVCNLVVDKVSSMAADYNDFERTTQKNYYWIVENLFDNELEHRFWNSENSLDRIKSYYREMRNTDEYKYLEMVPQDITIKTIRDGKEKFVPFSNYSVSPECLKEFKISASEGRLFTKDEMNISLSDTTIPVLLGYNMENKYKVGDIFEGTYFLRDISFKVIGVLEKNSRLIKTNIVEKGEDPSFYYVYLDDMFVTPLVNCEEPPNNREDRLFEKIIYMMKLNATIAAPPSYGAGDIKDKIDTLAAKYDMYEFEIIQISNRNLNLLKLVSKESIDIMAILAVILFAFSFISLWAILSVKINRNMGDYAIHLVVGARKTQIVMSVVSEMTILFLFTQGVAFIATKTLFSDHVPYTLTWSGICLAAFACAAFYPVKRLLGQNIDILLQGDSYE